MKKLLLFVLSLVLFAAEARSESIPADTETPLRICVSTNIKQLGKVNDQAENFDMTFDLQLRWHDPRLKFDTIANGSDRKVYLNEEAETELKNIWTPEIQIRNMNGKPARVEQVLFVSSTGDVRHVQRIKALFDAKFKMQAFPFDTQELPVKLSSSKYNCNQIVLVQEQTDMDSSGFKQGLGASSFKVKELKFSSGRERGISGESFPTFDARLIVVRDPYSHLIAIFCPFLALLFIPTVLTLYAKIDIAPRLTAWAASILALIALNSPSPPAIPSQEPTA
jgi:hypothetical protein